MIRAASDHIPALDGLRGMALLMLVVSHFSGLTLVFDNMFGEGAGVIGVMQFFILSGFLMGHLYFSRPSSFPEILVFLVRRSSRILPLFVFVVLLSYASSFVFEDWRLRPYNIRSLGQVIQHFTLIKAEGVLWTVLVEIKFYTMFPLFWIAYHFSPRKGFILALIAIAAAWAYNDITYRTGHHPEFITTIKYGQTLRCSTYFFVGIAIAAFRARWMSQDIAQGREGKIWDGVWLLSMVGIASLYPYFSPFVPREFSDATSVSTYTLMWGNPAYLIITTVNFIAILKSPIANRFLGSRLLCYFGTISYSVYVWHMPIFGYFNRFTTIADMPILFFITAFPLIIAVSEITYNLIEVGARRSLNKTLIPLIKSPPWKRSAERQPAE